MQLFFYIVLVLLLAYSMLIDYYRRAWNSIPIYHPTESAIHKTRISIIIAARNEEKNISACLQAILQQSYPRDLIEIIVVNDHSTDRTEDLVRSFSHQSIRLINLRDFVAGLELRSYKKKAIEIAIAQATGELILCTDADCIVPVKWAESIVSFYEVGDAVFIAAPVRIADQHSLLSIFQCLDFIALQGITGASVYSMCNGANLAYEKKAFHAVGGFEGIDSIASGDDMLLMHKMYNMFPGKIYFLKSREAMVSTEPATDWNAFFNQRARWAGKADKYEDRRIFWTLLAVYLLNLSILAFLAGAFWNLNGLLFFVILIIIKTIIEFPFVYTVAAFFEQKKLMRFFFFLQPLHLLYIVIAGLAGKLAGYKWKGRSIKS